MQTISRCVSRHNNYSSMKRLKRLRTLRYATGTSTGSIVRWIKKVLCVTKIRLRRSSNRRAGCKSEDDTAYILWPVSKDIYRPGYGFQCGLDADSLGQFREDRGFSADVEQMGETNIVEAAASGIQVSLLTTCFGLIVGIPAFVAFNYFTSVINRFVLQVEQSATELIENVSIQLAAAGIDIKVSKLRERTTS